MRTGSDKLIITGDEEKKVAGWQLQLDSRIASLV